MTNQISSHSIETISGNYVDVSNPKSEQFHIEDIAWSLSREPRFNGHTIHNTIYSVAQHSLVVTDLVQGVLENTLMRKSFMKFVERHHHTNDVELRMIVDLLKYLDNSNPKGYMAMKDSAFRANLALCALLHDGSEAYLRDIASPVKSIDGLKEAYGKIEKSVMKVIYKTFLIHELENFDILDDLEYVTPFLKILHWADEYSRTIEAFHLLPSRGLNWPSFNKMGLTLEELQKFKAPMKSSKVNKLFLERFKKIKNQQL